jgi:phosphoribosylformylglycinamidine cyclo-ligase
LATYRDSGVDIDAMNEAVLRMKQHVRSTFTPGVLSDVGSFGGMFRPNWTSFTDPVLVSSIDGVGTKVQIAALAGRCEGIGADLVAHCVNDILVQGARPLFFLDYFAGSRLDPSVVTEVVAGVARGCREAGCALVGGETAEMPGTYREGEFDVAGCIVGIVDRQKIVTGERIRPGDPILGLASMGLHTNGYSLARKALFEMGGLNLDDRPEKLGGQSVADALLAPHKCYARSMLPLVEEGLVKGMSHLTGGGFLDNIPRTLPEGCGATLYADRWRELPVFGLIRELGNVPEAEMQRTFNLGVGMTFVVSAERSEEIAERLRAGGEEVSVIGEVRTGDREVVIRRWE